MSESTKRSMRVGITGGIGSGKTAVTNLLGARGVAIVDADVVARDVVEPGSEALFAIAEHFGAEVIKEDESLDRGALRKIVFASPDERRWLESLTHPLIRERIAEKLNQAKSPYVVLSSPLLLESGQNEFTDHVVVVDVPEALQIRRAARRDDTSEELVRSIMHAQMQRQDRIGKANSVIDNSGTLEELKQQVLVLHEKLLSLSELRAAH